MTPLYLGCVTTTIREQCNMIINVRIKRKTELALLLLAVFFVSAGADLMAARNAVAQAGAGMAESRVVGRGSAAQGSNPPLRRCLLLASK
jgi:microcompartment protein CcmK/EutM